MSLGILAIRTDIPAAIEQNSLLGAKMPSVYRHLYDEAGSNSRPLNIKRGITQIPTAAYSVPTSESTIRSTDMTSASIKQLLSTKIISSDEVNLVAHTQCTLDQQMLSSTCLRIQHEYFPNSERALTIGQLGTAGIGTAFKLAQYHLQNTDGIACISAADKWIAPFIRRYGELVTYADASAACLLERSQPDCRYATKILATAVVNRVQPADFWNIAPQAHAENMVGIAVESIRLLFNESNDSELKIDGIFGDAYGMEIGLHVATKVGLKDRFIPQQLRQSHESSAAALSAIHQGIEFASLHGKALTAVIWTASLSGHAAAMLVRCYPSTQSKAGTWIANS